MDDASPDSWPRLVESLRAAPVVRMGSYDYFVHPLTDGVAPLTKGLLADAVDAVRGMLPTAFDVLLAPEAMGLPLATALTLALDRPFLVARKRSYGLPGEVEAPYRTGYAQGKLFLNGIRAGDRVVLVDDVLSRGGTVRALAQGLRTIGARLEAVVVLINKGHDLAALSREIGAPVRSALTIRVAEGRVEVLDHAAARL